MRNSFLPFCLPTISEDDISAVGDVLRSGWITTGPKSADFENRVCEYTGCEGAVALASATGGMHLLLKALDIKEGDEVITPSLTWVSTINLITLCGATPVFVDVDKDTLMITADEIEKKITSKTKLIVPVHYAGAPVDIDAINAVAKARGIPVAQDAAHAIGTFYKGEHIGKTGTAIYSFHPIKNITTGEGGMFCSDDSELLDRIRRLKFHGLGVDAFDRQTQGRAPQAQVLEPGFKYNMTDISAILGLRQLAQIDHFNQRREDLAKRYLEKLTDVPELKPLSVPDYPHKHAWHLFIVRLDIDALGMSRDDFMAELKKKNIGTGLHFRAAHTQKYYAETLRISPDELPNTEWNSERIFSLPLFPNLTNDDQNDVIDAIKEIIYEHK